MGFFDIIINKKTKEQTIPESSILHPKWGFKPPTKQAPSKKKKLPTGIKMRQWGNKDRPFQPVDYQHGENWVQWEVVQNGEEVIRGNISPELDDFDFEYIEKYGLNGEVYETIKVAVLSGKSYKDIASDYNKSLSWVKQVARYIKRADEDRSE